MSNHNYNITIISTNKFSNKKKEECTFTLEANKENLIEIDKKTNTSNFQIKFKVENVPQQNQKGETAIKNAKVRFQESELASTSSTIINKSNKKKKPSQGNRNADNVSQPKKRKYQQNNKSGTIAKRSKTVNFKEGQLVLVEWKGSPHWPAIISNILGNVANVTFYGTHDT